MNSTLSRRYFACEVCGARKVTDGGFDLKNMDTDRDDDTPI